MTEFKEWRIDVFKNGNSNSFYFDDMRDAIRWAMENQSEYNSIFILERIISEPKNVYDVIAQLK